MAQENYHTQAQKYITGAKKQGMKVKAEGEELIAYPKGSNAQPKKTSMTSRMNNLIGGIKEKTSHLDDVQLNKSGTVGTEPIGKPQKDGSIKRYTEVKLGKIGKIDIPRH